MKMPNMANGRDGFPCALNPVGDIFQRGALPFKTEASIDLGEASQEKKVLVGQIADSATLSRLFRREMRFWREMPKDLYHLYQMNKLNCISEAYTGTGHLSICTKPVPTCTTYTQGKASSELVKAATHKAKGNSRSQSPFFLAGPLSLIFSSVKVTTSDSAEVTVSMTSEDSAGYTNLSSPESGSAKYSQHRSPTRGVCPDNLLNKKAESAFVQAADIAQTLCVTIGNSQNQQGLGSLRPRHVQKNDFRTLEDVLATVEKKGSIRSATLRHGGEVSQLWDSCLALLRSRYFTSLCNAETTNCPVVSASSFSSSTAFAISCGTRAAIVCDFALTDFVAITQHLHLRCSTVWQKKSECKRLTCSTPLSSMVLNTRDVRVQQLARPGSVGTLTEPLTKPLRRVTIMACSHDTQTRPKFTDTYWIVPCYETTPYGKVSFTRQDRRIFIALFKDSRLIWAGRQLVKDLTENVICTQLQKVGVKRSANSTMSAKGTESCRGQSVSDIVKQGGVNITPSSTITEIVTVQGVAHV